MKSDNPQKQKIQIFYLQQYSSFETPNLPSKYSIIIPVTIIKRIGHWRLARLKLEPGKNVSKWQKEGSSIAGLMPGSVLSTSII